MTLIARNAALVALCTERFTSSGLAAEPAPHMPPSAEPSIKPEESVITSSGSVMAFDYRKPGVAYF